MKKKVFIIMELKKFIRTSIRKHLNENQLDKIQNIGMSINNEIKGGFLNKKQAEDLKDEIEANYISFDKDDKLDLFNRKKQDIKMNLFNYDNPIAEKDVNGVNLRIVQGFVRNQQQTYLLYADGEIIGEFYSVKDIKKIIKLFEDNLIKSPQLPDNNNLTEGNLSNFLTAAALTLGALMPNNTLAQKYNDGNDETKISILNKIKQGAENGDAKLKNILNNIKNKAEELTAQPEELTSQPNNNEFSIDDFYKKAKEENGIVGIGKSMDMSVSKQKALSDARINSGKSNLTNIRIVDEKIIKDNDSYITYIIIKIN